MRYPKSPRRSFLKGSLAGAAAVEHSLCHACAPAGSRLLRKKSLRGPVNR